MNQFWFFSNASSYHIAIWEFLEESVNPKLAINMGLTNFVKNLVKITVVSHTL